MAHDVFISYDHNDKPIADGICANLEAAGIRCWIAPRDIGPDEVASTAITTAISNSRVMVLVFSASSNASDDIGREIILAANQKLVIIPFKIENVTPEPGKQYYLARTHWLEAMNPPTKEQIQSLLRIVTALIPGMETGGIVQPAPGEKSPQADSAEPAPAAKKKRSFLGWVWIPILLVLIILGAVFWPNLQAMLASPTSTETIMPTLAATLTFQPSSTFAPTATFTQTPVLEPSATPTTGTVTGSVFAGDQPYAGVTVILCSDWSGACWGQKYTAETDAQGEYVIQNIEPGVYEAITSVPEQLDLYYPGEYRPKVQVNAGETVKLESLQKCIYDLQVTPSVQNNRVSLRVSAYPGMNIYTYYVGNSTWSGGEWEWNSVTTSFTTNRSFETGNYIWSVSAAGEPSGRCASAIGWITIP